MKLLNSIQRLRSEFNTIGLGRIKRLATESAWIIAGQIAAVIGLLALVRVLTEHLAPEQYGQLALGLSLGVLVCQLSMSGVMPGIMRYYSIATEQGGLRGYTNASVRLMIYGTLATIVLGFLLMLGIFVTEQYEWLGMIVMAILLTQIGSYANTLSSILNAARHRSTVALHSAADPWLRNGLAVTTMSWLGESPEAVMLGYMLAALLLLASQIFFVLRMTSRSLAQPDQVQANWTQRLWNYSKPFVTINAFTWAQANSDRWALQAASGTQFVGQYSVLMQLGYAPISMAIGLLTNFIAPILHQRSGDAMDQLRNKNVHDITWILTSACLLLTLFVFVAALGMHGWLFSILVAPDYRANSYLLPWIILAGGLFSAGQILALKLMSELNTKALILPKLVTSFIGMGLCFAGAFYLGLEGVVAASVLFSATALAWLAILAARRTK